MRRASAWLYLHRWWGLALMGICVYAVIITAVFGQ